jgi:hypothetical protein
MRHVLSVRKPVALIVILAFVNLVVGLAPVHAAMIETGDVMQQEVRELDKERLLSMLERTEVQQKLESWGVDPDTARARINALTEQELADISDRMEGLPAGGDALGTIVGAAVLIFIVLLITDILGLTHVFSFVTR